VDIDPNPDGLVYVERLQNGGRTIPTIAFPDGSHVIEPGNEEGLFLAQFARRVRVVARNGLTASRVLVEKVRRHPQFAVHTGTDIVSFAGTGGRLTEVVARDRETGEELRWHPAAAFVFIGLTPNTGWLGERVERDQWGFVVTDDTFATSMPGVYAAGDVRARSTKQLGAAVGDGIAALIAIRSYLQRVSDLPMIDINA
jgi:thioredoxin reductase (NADPH)